MKTVEGKVVAEGLKIGIVGARFNEFIVSKLISGARDASVRDMVSMTMILLLRGYLEHLKFRWLQRKWHCPANMMQ